MLPSCLPLSWTLFEDLYPLTAQVVQGLVLCIVDTHHENGHLTGSQVNPGILESHMLTAYG